MRKIVWWTDYFVVCSTQNERQSHAIAEELAVALKKQGVRLLGDAPASDGTWILQNFGDVVVHIFRDDARAFYDLEAHWADAPEVKWQRARRNGAK